MNARYIVFHGVPGSGKSTLAVKLLENLRASGSDVININRDDIRTELFGEDYHNGTPVKESEQAVTAVQNERTLNALLAGLIVINDDCNMNPKLFPTLRELIEPTGISIEHVFVDTPLETAKYRNRKRRDSGGRFVPPFIIEAMAKNKITDETPPKIMRELYMIEGEVELELSILGIE